MASSRSGVAPQAEYHNLVRRRSQPFVSWWPKRTPSAALRTSLCFRRLRGVFELAGEGGAQAPDRPVT